MVNITDVKQILQFAIDAEIKVFLDGGWGVDALLGHQSRAHNDIDIFVGSMDDFCSEWRTRIRRNR